MRLLGERLLVRPEPKDKVGNILLPETSWLAESDQGVVLAVGPGQFSEKYHKVISLEVHPGDRVFFKKGYGSVVEENDERLLILTIREVIAYIPA